MRTRAALVVVGFVASVAAAPPTAAYDPEDCAQFHDECVVAREQGEHDAGICNVERLECSTAPEPPSPTELPPARRGPARSTNSSDAGTPYRR
jgi:hypothetical protein